MTYIKINKLYLSILFLVLFLVIFIFFGFHFDLNKSEWASWVQAVGSIMAIGAAGAIAIYQTNVVRRLEQDKRNAEEVVKLNVVKALLARSHGLAKDVVNAVNDPKINNIELVTPVLMRDTSATLMALPLFEIPSGITALDVMTLGRGMLQLADGWESMREEATRTSVPPSSEIQAEIKEFAEELVLISAAGVNDCKKEVELRGGRLS